MSKAPSLNTTHVLRALRSTLCHSLLKCLSDVIFMLSVINMITNQYLLSVYSAADTGVGVLYRFSHLILIIILFHGSENRGSRMLINLPKLKYVRST